MRRAATTSTDDDEHGRRSPGRPTPAPAIASSVERSSDAPAPSCYVRDSVLIYIPDPWTIETQPLEFPTAIVLALHPPLGLHDYGPWVEWAPAAQEGARRIYDLGRHLLAGDEVCVKADGLLLVDFLLTEDAEGWHLSLRGPSGLLNTPLPDFDPRGSTGLEPPLSGDN